MKNNQPVNILPSDGRSTRQWGIAQLHDRRHADHMPRVADRNQTKPPLHAVAKRKVHCSTQDALVNMQLHSVQLLEICSGDMQHFNERGTGSSDYQGKKRARQWTRTEMISDWLEVEEKQPCPYDEFGLFEVAEASPPPEPCRALLAESILSARLDPSFLSQLARELGWHQVEELTARATPRDRRARAGDFGEVLAAALLKESHGYHVPVNKLRYRITRGQMLPSTDIFSLLTDANGAVSQVCYSESKFRASHDLGAATEGCAQLQETTASRIPEILQFVLARLHEAGNPLFDALVSFLKDRRDLGAATAHRIFLIFDIKHWDDRVLVNLEDSEPSLPNLNVHKVLIADLTSLVEDVFSRVDSWGAGNGR